jgi:LAGLIDADG endonuclease
MFHVNISKIFSRFKWVMLLRYLEFSNLTDTQLIEFVQLGPILLSVQKTEYLTLIGKNKRPFKIETKFLEWLVGFSDAEANFHLSLKNLTDTNFIKPQLTFQIGLHINHLNTLKLIQSKLHCGLISINKNKCNFFVNDIFSIINVILPIFDYFKLNSSKILLFNIFKIAAELMVRKEHLTIAGKNKLIKLRADIRNLVANKKSGYLNKITLPWLIGFIEGDATFSTNLLSVRLKFENTLVESYLFYGILDFLGLSKIINLQFPKIRDRGFNEQPVVVFEITHTIYIYKQLIPLLMSSKWYTMKFLDFKDWTIITKLQFFGYHLLPQGQYLIKLIKSRINNFRLTTNDKFNGNLIIPQNLFNNVFSLTAPYLDYGTFRVRKGVNGKLGIVYQTKYSITVTNLNKRMSYTSFISCATELKITRAKIVNCLINKISYKGYTFSINSIVDYEGSIYKR